MKRKIIAFTGLEDSGKTYSTNVLLSRTDLNFIPFSFGKHVKDAVSSMFGWDRNMLEGDDVLAEGSKKWRTTEDPYWTKHLAFKKGTIFENDPSITPRIVLQRYATELCRRNGLGDDFWILSMNKALESIVAPEDAIVVVTDCRFPNEAQYLLDMGASLYEINNPSVTNAYEKKKLIGATIHDSNKPLPSHFITGYIQNNGTLEQLSEKINNMFQ